MNLNSNQQELFLKYQRGLLNIVNNPVGRRLMELGHIKEKIVHISPVAHYLDVGNGKLKAVVQCRPKFADRIGLALKTYDNLSEAMRYWLSPETIGLFDNLLDNPTPALLFAGDVLPTLESVSAGDGSTGKTSTDLATARANDASAATTNSTSSNVNYLADGATKYVYRAFTPFPLSDALLTGGTIDAVSVKIKAIATYQGITECKWVETTQAAGNALAVSDHANFNTTDLVGAGFTPVLNTYNTQTFNAAGIAVVQAGIGSYAKVAPRVSADVAGSAVNNTGWDLAMADNVTSTNRPNMDITYTPGATAGPFLMLFVK